MHTLANLLLPRTASKLIPYADCSEEQPHSLYT